MGSRRTRSLVFTMLVSCLSLSPGLSRANADEFVNRVNSGFSRIPENKRSDLVLLPVLGKLESPPAEIAELDKALLLTPTSAAWESAMQWAQGATQKAVLKALTDITADEDYHSAMVFAQGYGVEAVADHTDLITAEMFTELGDPPMLANAHFGYLQKMREMQILSNIEASRLAHEGNFIGALDTLFDLLYFSRQLADRPMLPEKRGGMEGIRQSLERIRDVVYQDQRSDTRKLDYKDLRRYVERLEEQKGYLGISRIPLPTGTFEAAEQVLTRVLVDKKGVNDAAFATVLARVASTDRPLRLLSESAYWETVRASHEGWYAAHDMLLGRDRKGGLVYDWQKRWTLSPHDSYVKLSSDYRRHVAAGPKFSSLRAVLAGVEDLFALKTALRTEVAGTRMSLAVYGYAREHNGSFPPAITAIRPSYVPNVDIDPYSAARRPMGYFVPIRDNIPRQDPRKDPVPWNIQCYPPKPFKNFEIPLRDNTFVLFSVGPDDQGVNVKEATQADPEMEGDYLLWPPMLSLVRQHLMDSGELK